MSFKIMGIDQSLTCSGVVFLNADGNYSSTTIKPKTFGVKRLLDIEAAFARLIEDNNVDLVVMEGYAMGMQIPGRVFSLGELGGIIKRLMYLNDKRLVVIAPTSLKKYATGKGNCKKNKLILGIYKKWQVEFDTDDEADAYGLAEMGKNILLVENGTLKTKQQAKWYDGIMSASHEVLQTEYKCNSIKTK